MLQYWTVLPNMEIHHHPSSQLLQMKTAKSTPSMSPWAESKVRDWAKTNRLRMVKVDCAGSENGCPKGFIFAWNSDIIRLHIT